MTESGRQVALASTRIMDFVNTHPVETQFDPRELKRTVSGGRQVGAYDQAMLSLLQTGQLVQADNYMVKLP